MEPSAHELLLSVEPFTEVPGIRAFARRVDALWESTQILDRAWTGATEQMRAAGEAISAIIPDWEVVSIRWRAFVADTRELVRDAIRWFRSSARDAVRFVNGLILELDEFLGLTAAWTELREWVLRELRAFRSGPTTRERLDHLETSAGVTLGLIAAAAVAGLGIWGWLEWRRSRQGAELLDRLAKGGDDGSVF